MKGYENDLFVEGPIPLEVVNEQIAAGSSDERAGATEIFLGRVRNDLIEGKKVKAIEYTAYREMAREKHEELQKRIFDAHEIRTLGIYHSLGTVPTGEISLFVYITAEHQSDAARACDETVSLIKEKLPIWGREMLSDGDHVWK